MPPRNPHPVAVVGAGIAGLVAALSLARRRIDVDIVERAPALTEVGAGLQLSPNATRILQTLGLDTALEPLWSEPSGIRLSDGTSLRRLATVPAGHFARERWGAPYAVIARAALQDVLVNAVRAHPLCRLHLGAAVDAATPDAIAAVTGRAPGLIVGADGMRSRVRQAIAGHGSVRFSGMVAWRLAVAPGTPLPAVLDPSVVTAYLGRNAHVVAYPAGRSGGSNIVVVASGLAAADAHSYPAHSPSDPSAPPVASLLPGWHREIRQALSRAEPLGLWPLYEVEDGAWHDASRVLIGDAAHAMLPFAAQGAAMAIEDGFELAAALAPSLALTEDAEHAGEPQDREATLAAFVRRRKARIDKVRARGAFNRFAYHAAGPVRLGRDIVLSLRGPERLAEDFDWLYGYRSPPGP